MLPDDAPVAIGKPSNLTRLNIIATVVQLIMAAWKAVRIRTDVDRSSDEPSIAGALYWELVAERDKRAVELLIINEAASRRSESSLKLDGIIDFAFYFGLTECKFFGLECKRVDSTNKNLAKKYVTEGLMDFVTGKYCPGHDTAAMLGFVIDGNVAGSISLVRDAVMNTQASNKMKKHWNFSKAFGNHPNLYTTSHLQHGQQFPITILHLFQEL